MNDEKKKTAKNPVVPVGFHRMLDFGLLEAILGRRSRRVFVGAEIPDGVFAYKSDHEPIPLSELEKLLVVTACGGNTGWHHMIYRAARCAPKLPNYAGAAGGRTFPSAGGFHTSMTFFTDDDGVYVLDTRDAPACARPDDHGRLDLSAMLNALGDCVQKIRDGRLGLPAEVPHVEPHNTWVANKPGTLLIMPVGDLAQHALLGLAYLLQNGFVIQDDVHGRSIPGIDRFRSIVDPANVWPLSFFEQLCQSELTAELTSSCYAGTLMLQAMGLGGWMLNGIDPFSLLGASGDPAVPGLGFRYDTDDRWSVPNPTGLEGVMEGFCPPHHADMRAAVEAMCARKFGRGGPFHPETPGPWRDSTKVRSSAEAHGEAFRECLALQAQYVYDTFGKFPGTVPSIWTMMYLQGHHLDLAFYDRFYEPGAYLHTHAVHMEEWHGSE